MRLLPLVLLIARSPFRVSVGDRGRLALLDPHLTFADDELVDLPAYSKRYRSGLPVQRSGQWRRGCMALGAQRAGGGIDRADSPSWLYSTLLASALVRLR